MMQFLTRKIIFQALLVFIICGFNLNSAEISEATSECLDCHVTVTPGLVADWQNSRHAIISPAEALQEEELSRRVSSEDIPEQLRNNAVGCAECHTLNADTHDDTFEHVDYRVHTVVSPEDCAVCHAVEVEEYSHNLMSDANINLTQNELYQTLTKEINSLHQFSDGRLSTGEPEIINSQASCLSCHGTEVKVEKIAERETDLGEMPFPVLSGWPNQGVGRINPDGSVGACTSCHVRHQFSIAMARKPYTCSQCHKGPDVPAYKVYQVSKHGNIYSSLNESWHFDAVPWTVGRDFTAPTCAVCHVSLIVDADSEIIANRSHRMNDRLDKRLFGLIYAHPHPVSSNTSIIVNKAGLPLPTELTGEAVEEYVIDDEEQKLRRETMQKVCRACHSQQWIAGHFAMLDSTIAYTNAMTLAATQLMSNIWQDDLAWGLPHDSGVFDDAIERQWVEQWLFYANSVRFAAAMSGADYGVFANGRWYLSKNLREMQDWYNLHRQLQKE